MIYTYIPYMYNYICMSAGGPSDLVRRGLPLLADAPGSYLCLIGFVIVIIIVIIMYLSLYTYIYIYNVLGVI